MVIEDLSQETQFEVEVVNQISMSYDNEAVIVENTGNVDYDDETTIIYLNTLLEDICDNCLIARNGSEAVELCRDNPNLDLIMMDIKMPGMNGYEATRKIREFNKDVAIIAQTAFALQGDREKTIEAGCNGYVSKPVMQDTLMEEITRLIKK